MRIPLFIAIPITIATIALVWWNGVKHKNFLKPPDAAIIAKVKADTLAAIATPSTSIPETPVKAILVKPTRLPTPDPALLVEEEKPEDNYTVDMGDLAVAPGLETYSALAEKGSAHIIDLATTLETRGEIQRALLAWERVADSTSPDAAQRDLTLKSIQRLNSQVPPWNIDPTARVTIMLHAGCDNTTSTLLKPVLEEAAALLCSASSGMLTIETKISAGKSPTGAALPVALWFSGTAEDAQQSKTITMPPGITEPSELRNQLLASLYKIIREDIGSQTVYQPPTPLADAQDPTSLFSSAITRLHWHEFSQRLIKTTPPAP